MPLFSVTAARPDGTVIVVGVVAEDTKDADEKARKYVGGVGNVNVTQWDNIFSVTVKVGVGQGAADDDHDDRDG